MEKRNNPMSTIMLLLLLLMLMLISVGAGAAAQSAYMHRTPMTEVDALRIEYLSLERALWIYLNKTANSQNNKETQLRKVYDSHRNFINKRQMGREFASDKYKIMHHFEWNQLEMKLTELNRIFDFYKNILMKPVSSDGLEERAVLDLTLTVLRNDKHYSMSQIFQTIEEYMVKQTLYYRAMVVSADEMCHTKQSAQQFVYSLYTDIALTELKGYTMMEFSWMMLRVYGRGNFSQEAELMRRDYEKRTERTLKLLKEVMRRSDRIVWRCDPEHFVLNKTYDEVTRLLQGYIENEVDLNADETCRETCSFYQSTRSEGCFKEYFCARQPKCTGRLYNCQFVDSDMWVCPAARNSTRRYEYIEYENGRVLGRRQRCVRGTTKVDSWWRYLFWHCSYCFCLCDEQGLKSDRFFNLRESVADVKKNNVVTGLRFVKRNRVFHLQIQEGQLLPRGAINESTLSWKPVDEYKIYDRNVAKGIDYHTLSYESRSIDLDDIMKTDDYSFVVTGLRFRVLGAHLNLEARLTEFDFTKGELIQPEVNSVWQSNDNTDVSGERRQKINIYNADVPTRSVVTSIPMSKHNQYIEFVNSGMDKDAAQSTVPFLDIQDVVSQPPVPLAGIGLYYKGRPGYGGFLAPKIITYDFTPHVQVPKNIN
ncbi:uncharacterized protein LOC6585004 isoform X2 [Drosophila mojavensis]|uniref:Uncharacterized protein, isoform B n=1 Tax=Drosophila mojavensis TaxID=7230 RepID=A0A0Q9XEZ3_DROMO|nr:uncharacterized protein LOC6585004 isoform X2 [Drosophila mojavensis]KRG06869.1 uncharacterized protein Dmoj_GI21656, isoform B [Drosophila mojavensis]